MSGIEAPRKAVFGFALNVIILKKIFKAFISFESGLNFMVTYFIFKCFHIIVSRKRARPFYVGLSQGKYSVFVRHIQQ